MTPKKPVTDAEKLEFLTDLLREFDDCVTYACNNCEAPEILIHRDVKFALEQLGLSPHETEEERLARGARTRLPQYLWGRDDKAEQLKRHREYLLSNVEAVPAKKWEMPPGVGHD